MALNHICILISGLLLQTLLLAYMWIVQNPEMFFCLYSQHCLMLSYCVHRFLRKPLSCSFLLYMLSGLYSCILCRWYDQSLVFCRWMNLHWVMRVNSLTCLTTLSNLEIILLNFWWIFVIFWDLLYTYKRCYSRKAVKCYFNIVRDNISSIFSSFYIHLNGKLICAIMQ